MGLDPHVSLCPHPVWLRAPWLLCTAAMSVPSTVPSSPALSPQPGGLQPCSSPTPGEQSSAPASIPRSPRRLPRGTEEGPGSGPVPPPATLTDTPCLWEQSGGKRCPAAPALRCMEGLDGAPGVAPGTELRLERRGHRIGSKGWSVSEYPRVSIQDPAESSPPSPQNRRPKAEVVPSSGVCITHPQLHDLPQGPRDEPKPMTRCLLASSFTWETLARSSATGQRIARPTTTTEHPLRLPLVSAIKEYITSVHGCSFNAVINSGTSRPARKELVEKMGVS